jgi:laccase
LFKAKVLLVSLTARGIRTRASDTYALQVQWGKTYLLRIINAAVNDELFFSIAGHTMTVVEIDATYTKPLSASTIHLYPGQTTNVLVRADQRPGRYFMAAKPFNDVPVVPVDNSTATAILQYAGVPASALQAPPLLMMPDDGTNGTTAGFVAAFHDRLRSLNSARYPAAVPLAVNRRLLYANGLNIDPCASCPKGSRLAASLNNITCVMPQVALLEAHYEGLKGVFDADFPDRPPAPFNYTGAPPLTAGLGTSQGTRLSRVAYNASVELVLQETNLLSAELHPFHLQSSTATTSSSSAGASATSTRPRTPPSTTSSTRRRGTPSACPPVGGRRFGSGRTIRVSDSCTAIWRCTRAGA